MKIGIIGFSDRNNMPYLKYYEDVLKKNKITYECIFWDRFKNNKTSKIGNEYNIHIECKPGVNKIGKILPMLKFKIIVEQIIKKECYSHLIVLTTVPGVLLHSLLVNKFKNKYVLDIRDYSYEKFYFYKKIVDNLISKSFFTAISSRGFQTFLAENQKIILCHNLSNVEEIIDKAEDLKIKNKITIGFVGGIRFFEENCKLLDSLANSRKYQLAYIGRANIDCDLEGYCKNRKIDNVTFNGYFKNDEKPLIYRKIDIINAVYGNKSLRVTTALPNRMYDGLLFKKPIIATKGTYLGKIVEKYNIGCTVELNKNIVIDIDEYLNKYDEEEFLKSAKNLLEIVENEQKQFVKNINKFIGIL